MARVKLSRKQRDFNIAIARLMLWGTYNGYEFTFGDAYRDPRVHGKFGEKVAYGSRLSFHKKRLAMDLNLFVDDKYQASTKAHEPIGIKWEEMGGTWGGRFSNSDGNHYSWGENR
jgi:hypothetical protein